CAGAGSAGSPPRSRGTRSSPARSATPRACRGGSSSGCGHGPAPSPSGSCSFPTSPPLCSPTARLVPPWGAPPPRGSSALFPSGDPRKGQTRETCQSRRAGAGAAGVRGRFVPSLPDLNNAPDPTQGQAGAARSALSACQEKAVSRCMFAEECGGIPSPSERRPGGSLTGFVVGVGPGGSGRRENTRLAPHPPIGNRVFDKSLRFLPPGDRGVEAVAPADALRRVLDGVLGQLAADGVAEVEAERVAQGQEVAGDVGHLVGDRVEAGRLGGEAARGLV